MDENHSLIIIQTIDQLTHLVKYSYSTQSLHNNNSNNSSNNINNSNHKGIFIFENSQIQTKIENKFDSRSHEGSYKSIQNNHVYNGSYIIATFSQYE